jgi:hypothetical protein
MNSADPQRWSVEALAAKFRVREQRVAAILALKGGSACVALSAPVDVSISREGEQRSKATFLLRSCTHRSIPPSLPQTWRRRRARRGAH